MFHSSKIQSIKPSDRVLEIGPGSSPYPRSDILLERRFDSEINASAQRGFAPKVEYKQPVVYYDGGRFPFNDKEFDYVICSHVIEHVPIEELDLFFTELQRVSSKGYIEFPNIFYELINYQSVHKWFMNYRDGVILFLDKTIFTSNYIHKIYRESFYGKDDYLKQSFGRYKAFFFVGFEWFDVINYKIVKDYDTLVNQKDYDYWKQYFSESSQSAQVRSKKGSSISRLTSRLRQRFSLLRKNIFNMKNKKYFIDKTAVLEKRSLVKIGDFAEIKEYVIIKTYKNQVVIGKYSQLNPFTVIYGGSGVQIGDNVMIAPHCMIAAGNHDFSQTEKPMRFAGSISKGPIIIEDNVWIGANCIITDGVRIGKDSVIGANSVVTADVNPYDIVGGVPAKFIKNRCTGE